ncbi:13132_t:CDS:2 [Gigaspora margarita]|uniref:13132_t:CDS:1 n=1 Tax=Gigaspora margarita TaxID=4874 RepID=A0ABN7WA18_GIGMA|nr:13132_t:CDS:2 [Gigaspora margarita]
MFPLRNRFKKSILQQSYDIYLHAKKTSLDDFKFYNNLDYSNTDLILQTHRINDQQSEQDTDLGLGQEFDNLIYDNSEDISMCSENGFNSNVDCSSDNESELMSTNIDDLPKIFDKTKSDLNWNYECLFESFNNFTNLAMFI